MSVSCAVLAVSFLASTAIGRFSSVSVQFILNHQPEWKDFWKYTNRTIRSDCPVVEGDAGRLGSNPISIKFPVFGIAIERTERIVESDLKKNRRRLDAGTAHGCEHGMIINDNATVRGSFDLKCLLWWSCAIIE